MTVEHVEAIAAAVTDPRHTTRWNYYTGDHPRVYATPKLREVFRNLADSMTENYCNLAIDARLNRLEVTGFDGPDAAQAEAVFTGSNLWTRQDRVMRWALVHGAAVILTDTQTRTISVNPTTVAALIPDPTNPDMTLAAGKLVTVTDDDSGDPYQLVVMYYADRTEWWRKHDAGWRLDSEPVPQPSGAVPAVEIRPYGDGPPLIDVIAPVQDRINKLGSNKMIAAEFGAFRQRAFITRQKVDPFTVRQQPDHAIVLDPGDPDAPTRVHEFTATELRNYDDSKSSEIDGLFTLASLPRHMRVNPGATPSGAAILADEGPLVEVLATHQREVGEAWSSALRHLDIDASPVWRDVEPHDDLINAQEFVQLVAGGLPWQTAARRALKMTDADLNRAAYDTVPAGDPTGAALLADYAE